MEEALGLQKEENYSSIHSIYDLSRHFVDEFMVSVISSTFYCIEHGLILLIIMPVMMWKYNKAGFVLSQTYVLC